MSLTEAEELELLELEEAEYQDSLKNKSQGIPSQGGSKLGELGGYALKGLGYAGGLVRTAGGELVDAFADGNIVDSKDWNRAFKGEAPNSAELMQRFGVPEGERFNLLPEFKVPFTDVTLGRGDSSARDVGGFALDVATDPLTYGTLGLSSLFKKSGKTFTKEAAEQAAAKASAKGTAKSASSISDSTNMVSNANIDTASYATLKGGGVEAEQTGKLFEYKAPETLEELRSWQPEKGTGQVLGEKRLRDIEATVPDLKTKPLRYHYKMMDNPKAMKDLKLSFENLPTSDAKKIALYNQEIVNESARKINSSIEDFSGGVVAKNLSDAGDNFISTAKEIYEKEKEILAPVFQDLQKNSFRLRNDESADLIQSIASNSKVGKLITQNPENGRFLLKKNTPRSGISDKEHGVINKLIQDLNKGMSFREIQNARDYLRKIIDPSNPGATSEIGKVRSILLGQLEELASKRGNVSVADTFKRYAINEQTREAVEKIIGGKIDAIDSIYAANPEKVLRKIFSNPNYTKIVSQYIGPQKTKELIASYINNGLEGAFDSAKGFQPHTARRWIDKNKDFLKNNTGEEFYNRLSALADYGFYGKRFLDEVNPSGTAASLARMIEPKSFTQKIKNEGISGALKTTIASKLGSMYNQKKSIESISEALSEASSSTSKTKSFSGNLIDFLKNKKNLMSNSKVLKVLSNPTHRKTIGQLSNVARVMSVHSPGEWASNDSKQDKTKYIAQLKGPRRWAFDGYVKIIQSKDVPVLNDLDSVRMLYSTPKGRKLLIAASSAKPGSKAMDKIVKQLEKLGRGNQ